MKRNFIQFYINNQEYKIYNRDIFKSLSDFLRYDLELTGTKVVCAEGDCGACSIIGGKLNSKNQINFRSLNSCITYLFNIDMHVIYTIEYLNQLKEVQSIQNSFVKNHASQCGFCTPGFIVSLTDHFHRFNKTNVQKVKNATTGNLCRCTGYKDIIEASSKLSFKSKIKYIDKQIEKNIIDNLSKNLNQSVLINEEKINFYAPFQIKDALEFKAKHTDSIIVANFTDLGVLVNKGKKHLFNLLSLQNIKENEAISISKNNFHITPKATLIEVEDFFKDKIQEFSHLLHIFASPQIKHRGTLIGNVANGSPIGDTLGFLKLVEANISLKSLNLETKKIDTRIININDFYLDYKKFNIKPNEIIDELLIPLKNVQNKNLIIKLYKMSRRKDLDISAVTLGILLDLDNNKKIKNLKVTFGGVGPIVLRFNQIEDKYLDKSFNEENFKNLKDEYLKSINPISDLRASKEFRLKAINNLFNKFYFDQTGVILA